MGFDKFRLPLGEQTFLESVTLRLLSAVDGPVIAAASQETEKEVRAILVKLPSDRIHVVVDQRDAGPLEGIRAGLEKANEFSNWAFVTSCDVPLIVGSVLEVLQTAIQKQDREVDAVIPISRDRIFGMTALYRCHVHSKINLMIEKEQLRVSELASQLAALRIDIEKIREADPNLDSIRNLNSPSQYLEFLGEKGFECLPEFEQKLNWASDV